MPPKIELHVALFAYGESLLSLPDACMVFGLVMVHISTYLHSSCIVVYYLCILGKSSEENVLTFMYAIA